MNASDETGEVRAPPPSSLTLLDLVLVVGLTFLAGVLVAALAGEALAVREGLPVDVLRVMPGTGQTINIAVLAGMGLSAILLILGLAQWRGLSPGDLGFRRAVWWYFPLAVALLITFLMLSAQLLLLLEEEERTAIEAATREVLAGYGWQTWAKLVLVVLLAPFAEELFFRSALFGALSRHMPQLLAGLAATLIFTAGHVQYSELGGMPALISLTQIFFLGATAQWLFVASGSIWPPIVMHMSMNGLAAIGVMVSQAGAAGIGL